VILIDTSIWISFFRSGDHRIVTGVWDLLEGEQAVLAAPVRIELLIGASRRDRTRLDRLLSALPVLYPSHETWRRIDRWIDLAAKAGQRFGFADLLIASLGADEGAAVWSLDRDFKRMARLGFIERHVPS
jgi:predicted nucleic acid-binding protein